MTDKLEGTERDDALAELTLSILQKDKMRDPALGYPRDIELHAKILYPMAFKNGIRVVTDSGGLNPISAANKVSEILKAQGVTGVKIAIGNRACCGRQTNVIGFCIRIGRIYVCNSDLTGCFD